MKRLFSIFISASALLFFLAPAFGGEGGGEVRDPFMTVEDSADPIAKKVPADPIAKKVLGTVVDRFYLSIEAAAKKQKKQDIVKDRKTFYSTLTTQAAVEIPAADRKGYQKEMTEYYKKRPNHEQLKSWTTVMTQFENELVEVFADKTASIDEKAQQVLALLTKYSIKTEIEPQFVSVSKKTEIEPQWLYVTSDTTFQGASLFAGWDLISLD